LVVVALLSSGHLEILGVGAEGVGV